MVKNIISDWLEKYGDKEIDALVESQAYEIISEGHTILECELHRIGRYTNYLANKLSHWQIAYRDYDYWAKNIDKDD